MVHFEEGAIDDLAKITIETSFRSKLEVCKARSNEYFPQALNEINDYFLMFLWQMKN